MDLAGYSFEILTFLFVIAIIAGFIDTLVGGGGLLAVPALLLSGIPPIYVLGTNKFQGSMGTGIATFLLFRKKKLNWETIKYLMLASFIGSNCKKKSSGNSSHLASENFPPIISFTPLSKSANTPSISQYICGESNSSKVFIRFPCKNIQ